MARLGGDRIFELVDAATAIGGVDAAEALLIHQAGGLTRFADNRIHQATWRQDVELRVRVVVDGNRIGVASTHDATAEGARGAARRARETAAAMPPDTGFPGMPGPATYASAGRWDEATAQATPDRRAALVAEVIGRLPAGVDAAGALETSETEVGIGNTNGVRGSYAV